MKNLFIEKFYHGITLNNNNNNLYKIKVTGSVVSTNQSKEIYLKGEEKLSFSQFLDGKSEKTVNLERILGIGGEGIVLAQKMNTRENHYKARKNGSIENKGRKVALKFFELEKNDDEDFLGPEEEDITGNYGGINGNGKWVESQYFYRLKELGDFKAATYCYGGYSRPYIDFGISEIHNKYFYVIG